MRAKLLLGKFFEVFRRFVERERHDTPGGSLFYRSLPLKFPLTSLL